MNENTEFDVIKASAAQAKLCKERGYPHFAPKSGTCWRCNKNIYQPIKRGERISGISVERASSEFITGCPHCNRSYCD